MSFRAMPCRRYPSSTARDDTWPVLRAAAPTLHSWKDDDNTLMTTTVERTFTKRYLTHDEGS